MDPQFSIILTIVGVFIGNLSIILWFRGESRNDWRHLDQKLDLYSKESRDQISSLKDSTLAMIGSIKDDMKDFHERLLEIEIRRR